MLNSEKIWRTDLTDLSTSAVRCRHFTFGNPKKSFFKRYYSYRAYSRLFTLAQKKTNSNYCIAALAVYLLLFSAFYYLHSLNTASGARYIAGILQCVPSVIIASDIRLYIVVHEWKKYTDWYNLIIMRTHAFTQTYWQRANQSCLW